MWYKGHISPVWDNSFKDYKYIKQPISDMELDIWKNQGYAHKSFTGAMYGGSNPMPAWCYSLALQLGLYNPGFVFYRMITGDIMPTHIDHFNKYCEIFNVKRNEVYRAVIFLEDWKPGHYFEIENNAICNYKAGEFILWSHDTPHAASNIGVIDRYTLQITGTLNGK